jgi:tetratricopeptide (TPR) repeat protein
MSLNFQLAGDNNIGVDTHHSVLSVTPHPQKSLLEHLQVGMPSPLDLLLGTERAASQAFLGEVIVEFPLIDSPIPFQPAVIIEQGARLSQCKLWAIQENYYRNQGINAWENSVPNYVTSSVYMAESYAESILAFLTDYLDRLDLNEPVYIVEMATGAGRFSFHMLRELERKLACFSRFKNLNLRYIMTDFTANNAMFWQSHERFAPFVEKGMLDFAVFNPLVDDAFDLMVSGERLCGDQVKNPVIAIANYFFDSIPMDVFRVENKTLKEGLVTLERAMEGVDPESFPHITQISTDFQYRDILGKNYYPDAEMNEVLNYYRHNVKEGTVLFPVGAFDVLRNLKTLSNHQLVLLSSDKAYTCPEDMTQFAKHQFAIHDGAFSYMVNYHAIGKYFQNMGGEFFGTTAKNLSIQTVCCVSMDGKKQPFEQLQYVYQEKIDRFNPATSLCATLPGKEGSDDPVERLNYMLAQLRLHLADPFLFPQLAPQLVEVVSYGWRSHQIDLLDLMETALDNYYHCPGESNLPFWLSEIYFMMARYEQSLDCLRMTSRLFGENETLYFLMGQNYEKLNQLAKAKECYETALLMRSDFSEAQEALGDLQARMQ